MHHRVEHHFTLGPDTPICSSGGTDYVALLLGSASDGPELDIDFRPCHLPELREFILKLEALQDIQRQKEESANARELALKDEVTA